MNNRVLLNKFVLLVLLFIHPLCYSEVAGYFQTSQKASNACLEFAAAAIGLDAYSCLKFGHSFLEEVNGVTYEFWGPTEEGCEPGSFIAETGACLPLNQGRPRQCGGNPIDIAIGSKIQTETDFEGGGINGYEFKRYYNSRYKGINRWSHTYSRHVNVSGFLVMKDVNDKPIIFPSFISVQNDFGRMDHFNLTAEIKFKSSSDDNSESEIETSISAIAESKVKLELGQGYVSNGVYKFSNYFVKQVDGTIETYDSNGRILEIKYPNSQKKKFTYVDSDVESQIVVDNGSFHTLTIKKYKAGALKQVIVPAGNVIRYVGESKTIKVIYPDDNENSDDNATRTYHYGIPTSPALLTGITDEEENFYTSWNYLNGVATKSINPMTSSEVALDVSSLTAENPKVVVTNKLGKKTTYHYQHTISGRKVKKVEGHQSASCEAANQNYTYNDRGDIETQSDWEGNLTRFEYYSDGLVKDRYEAYQSDIEEHTQYEWYENKRLLKKLTIHNIEKSYFYDGYQITRVEEKDLDTNEVRITTYSYTDGLLTSVDGPLDGDEDKSFYHYENGQLSETVNAVGHRVKYKNYNENGYPQTIIDVNGVISTIEYDERGRVKTVIRHLAHENSTISYTYKKNNLLESITDNNLLTTFFYEKRRLKKILYPNQSKVIYEYDLADNITSIQVLNSEDVVVYIERKIYDELSRIRKYLDADGNTTKWNYDKNGNIVEQISSEKILTSFEFDELNNLLKTVFDDYYKEDSNEGKEFATWSSLNKHDAIAISEDKLSASISSSIWATGLADIGLTTGKWYWEITQPVNGSWNVAGIASESSSLSVYVGADSTSWGWIQNREVRHNGIAISAPAAWTVNDVIMFALDMDEGKLWIGKNGVWLQGDPVYSVAPLTSSLQGLTIYPAYSQYGINKLTANFGDKLTSGDFIYSPPQGYNGGVYMEVDMPEISQNNDNLLPPEINYIYSNEQLSGVKDQRSLNTSYKYNAFGELVEINSPDTGVTSYTHDKSGNVETATNAKNMVARFKYDDIGRLVSISYPDASEDVTFTYDEVNDDNYGVGQLTKIIDGSGSTELKYDINGKIVKKQYEIDGYSYMLGYGFDKSSRLTRVTYPSGRVINYEYNMMGDLDKITMGEGSNKALIASQIKWTALGRVKSFLFGNDLLSNRSYDLNGQLKNLSLLNEEQAITNADYDYYSNGNIKSIVDLAAPSSVFFKYDNANRLTWSSSNIKGDIGFTYDLVGNRLAKSENEYNIQIFEYATDSNQLKTETLKVASGIEEQFNYIYDELGSMEFDQKNGQKIIYNQANRPERSIINSNVTRYAHNALGQRVLKINGSKEEKFHYNELGQLIAVSEGKVFTREYVYLGGEVVAVFTEESPKEFNSIRFINEYSSIK